jgi:hypothetical protein
MEETTESGTFEMSVTIFKIYLQREVVFEGVVLVISFLISLIALVIFYGYRRLGILN